MTATIIDYLRWRGDLSFAERAFNAVDNLVLAEFCYLNFDGLVPDPASGDRVKLTTVAEQYLAQERGKDQGLQAHPDLLPPMINSNRFGNLWLSKYVNIVSDDADIQFCAFHIDIDEQTTYVAFRGTDETLVGWREDFMLSYEIVPAQRAAGQYLNQTVEIERNYLLGGHSKGGNLATYAMLELASSKQQLVEKVYSNDGPGIPQEHLDEQRFAAIRPKVLKIVPDSSLVGMLFHNGEETVVVASNKVDLAQHDGITWQVDAAEFQTVSELKPAAQRRNAVITEWINDAPAASGLPSLATCLKVLAPVVPKLCWISLTATRLRCAESWLGCAGRAPRPGNCSMTYWAEHSELATMPGSGVFNSAALESVGGPNSRQHDGIHLLPEAN